MSVFEEQKIMARKTLLPLRAMSETKSTLPQERADKLRTEPIGRLLFNYALPAVVGTVVMALYNIVDTMFIGQGVGEKAIAAISISFPIFLFLQGFGMLVGIGGAVRISILLGQQNYEGANRILGNAVMLTILFTLVSVLPCYFFMEPLLRMFGASDGVLPHAKEYLQILLPFNVFGTVSFGYNSLMRASGYPTKAMITMILGAVLNTIFDYIFIFQFHWGITGAAAATALAMFVSMCFVLSHFFSPKSLVRFTWKSLRPSWQIARSVVTIGLAPFFMQIVGSVVSIVMNRNFVTFAPSEHIGDLSVAVYGIINSYATLVMMVTIGVSQGMQPIVGYNFGAGQMSRVVKCFNLAVAINMAVTFIGFVVALLVPDVILSFYKPSSELIQLGVKAFRTVFLGFALVGFQITATQLFQSLGYSYKALFLSLTRQILFLLPGLFIFPRLFGFDGVWMAMPVADIAAALTAGGMIFHHFKYIFPKLFTQHRQSDVEFL